MSDPISNNSNAVETLDFLNAPDVAETTDKSTDKTSTEEIKDTETQDTQETEDSESNDLDLSDPETEELTYDVVPAVSQLKKEAPDLFKKYPTIEKALRREARYSEVFPTVQEAADAASAVQDYRRVESEINSGSITGLLSNIRQSNPQAFNQIAEGLLDTVRELDPQAFYAVTTQNVTTLLGNAFNKFKGAEKDSDNYQIALAAQILHNYISGGQSKVGEETTARTKTEDPRAKELSDREAAFEQKQFNSHASNVNGSVKTTIEASIEKALDPRGAMTSFVKSKATEECVNEFVENIKADARFNKVLTGLWEQSRAAGYTDSSKAKVRQALLNKAKAVLPDIIHRVKTEAMKGAASRRETESEAPVKRGRPTGSSTAPSSGKNGKSDIPRGMSSRDFLMQD